MRVPNVRLKLSRVMAEDRGSAAEWASLFWGAFDRSANPMALLEADRALVAINQAFVEDFGYRPDEAIGRLSDFLVAPRSKPQFDRDWGRLQRVGRLTGERELVRADGTHIVVQFAAHAEQLTGRRLILWVVLTARFRPTELRLEGRKPVTATAPKPLTPRELEIVREIAMGRRWHEIAGDLFITQSTVKTHVRNAMRKVGARSQAQLVAVALTTGMLDPARTRDETSP